MSSLQNFRPLIPFRDPISGRPIIFRSAFFEGAYLSKVLVESYHIKTHIRLHQKLPAEPSRGTTLVLRDCAIESAARLPEKRELSSGDYAEYYIKILRECAPFFAKAFCSVAEAAPHGVIISCLQGKDRTGLLCAALLEAVGATQQYILADYATSGPMLAKSIDKLHAHWEKRNLTMQEYIQRYALGAAPLQNLYEKIGTSDRPILSELLRLGGLRTEMNEATQLLRSFTTYV